MAYTINIPQSTDDPATQSQVQFLNNFNQLNTQISVNHTALTAGADNGKHTFISLLQSAAPITAAGEGSLYTFNTGGAREHAYWRRESNGISIPISTYIGAFVRVTGATGAIVGDSFNIASVVRASAGVYNVTYTSAITSGNYASIVSLHGNIGFYETESIIAGSIQVRTFTTAGAAADRDFSLQILGEIA